MGILKTIALKLFYMLKYTGTC